MRFISFVSIAIAMALNSFGQTEEFIVYSDTVNNFTIHIPLTYQIRVDLENNILVSGIKKAEGSKPFFILKSLSLKSSDVFNKKFISTFIEPLPSSGYTPADKKVGEVKIRNKIVYTIHAYSEINKIKYYNSFYWFYNSNNHTIYTLIMAKPESITPKKFESEEDWIFEEIINSLIFNAK